MEFTIYILRKNSVEWLIVIPSFVDFLSVYCDVLQTTCAQLNKIRLYYLVLVKLVENGQMVLMFP